MFKANKIFVQFFRNKVRAVYLNTGQEVTLQALTPFSSQRQVVSSFSAAEETLRAALKELGIRKSFMATKMVLQIAEGAEGGLSEIEKRALRDLAEQVDAKQVYIINRDGPVAMEEVMEVLK